MASGKSILGDGLIERFGVDRLQTRRVIQEIMGTESERLGLQKAGDRLDRKTSYRWVVAAVDQRTRELADDAVLLVDAVRRQQQIDAVRDGFGQRVVHVHLTSPPDVLEDRYRERQSEIAEAPTYAEAIKSRTEQQVHRLARNADVVIDTSTCSEADLVVRVAGRLGLYGRSCDPLVDVLVGGQWGSEGKGQVAAYLAPEYDVLLRVGGPNAGHKVFGRPARTYYHIPSGTDRNEDAKIILGPGAVIRLKDRKKRGKVIPGLESEIRQSGLTPDRFFIDPQAMMIEDEDIEIEEGNLTRGIGSTGQGVGVATSRKVLRPEAKPPVRLARDEAALAAYIRETAEVLENSFAEGKRVFLEGTQGTGLSLHHGSYPYVTSRETSISGCLADAGIAPARVRRTVVVCRSYPIRVKPSRKGECSGPMGAEISWEEVSRRSRIPLEELIESEKTSTTKRRRRVAEFDWKLFRRSVHLNAPTDIALTFADYFSLTNRKARRFEQLSPGTREFINEMELVASCPVSLVAVRFHYRPIIDRRYW